MSQIHYTTLFQGRDRYVVLHPSCSRELHAAAAAFPVHAVGRSKSEGPPVPGQRRRASTDTYEVDDASLLLDLLKLSGHWVCGTCKKAALGGPACPKIVWTDEWIQSVGMARYETVPEWEKFFESVADAVSGAFRMERENPASVVSITEHERVLEIVPPYDLDGVLKAFRAAAMKAHPDRGGSNEAMRRVIEARDALKMAVA